MAMRFAILKEINNTENEIILEYDEKRILSHLQAMVKEGLLESERFFKHSWSKAEIARVVSKAFAGLIEEFKGETIKLK